MSAEKDGSYGTQVASNDVVEQAPVSRQNPPTEDENIMERRIVRKIDLHILPVTIVVYLLCFIDRSNIGNARILNADTGDSILQTNHMSTYQYTIALMLFIVAYCVFEAPSNIMIKIATPRRWLGFLITSFGIFCVGIGGTKNAASVTALRFCLGAAEAGVFPGMLYYFSCWYRPEELAKRIATFMCSAALSGAFGGCIAFGVGHMNGTGGLEGWRWLFILEGIPSIIVGILVFFFLPSYPGEATWLTDEEKEFEQKRLGFYGHAVSDKVNWQDAKELLLDGRMYMHYMAYACVGCAIASLSLFAPTIVMGLGYEGLRAQLYTVPPYAVAAVFTIFCSYVSDKYEQRGMVAAGSNFLGCVAYIALAAIPGEHYSVRYTLLCIATAGVFGAPPALCAWIGHNSRTTTGNALATALNIAVAGPSQIIGVWIYRTQDAPIYRLGHGVNAAFLFLAAVMCAVLTVYYRHKNAKMVGTNEVRWAV